MKILVVSHEYPPIGGGGANACYFLTKGFVGKGHEVTVVTANYQGMPEKETLDGVEVVRVNAKRAHKEYCSFKEMLSYLSNALGVAEKLQKKHRYDVCLVFFGIPSGPIGYVLKKKYKLPYVIRFGGGDIPGFQERFKTVYKLIAPCIKLIWKNAGARIANSEGLKQMALDFYDKKDFGIINNGVDVETFYPQKRCDDKVFRLLFVSRLIERKGLQFIIPQIKEIVSKTEKKVELVVVGDGPYKQELVNITEQNNLSENVIFVGTKSRNEIVSYYQKADVFILPSSREGMPNVVLEAMSCGLPIIITHCEGSKELVTPSNGFITEKENFGNKIMSLINDDDLCREMGRASRKRVEEMFSWNKIVDQYLELLTEIG